MAEKKQTAKRACRIILDQYESLFQYKNSYVLKKISENFVEGLLIESTNYKNTFYVWSVICPSWHLSSEPKLDYSNRLSKGEYFNGDANEISKKIIEAVYVDDVAQRRCCGPPTQISEFFSNAESGTVNVTKVNAESHNNLNHVFDKAILLLLYGNVRDGHAALNIYNNRGNGNGKYASVATDLIAALEAEDGSWLGVIRDAQRRGREAMGLPCGDIP